MIKVSFETNIDYYSRKPFPNELPFRPMLGDRVPFKDQEILFTSYPFLEITHIRYMLDNRGNFYRFICYLDFSKHTHGDICRKILNHEEL